MAAYKTARPTEPEDGENHLPFAATGSAEGTSRIGAELRIARERLGYGIEEVAVALRLRPAFIRAIEQGDIRELPGTAYAVGFVRTYSTALGLDPDEAIRRFKAEREEVNRKTELTFPAPVPQRGVPAGALVLVGAVIAIGGYIGWYHYSGHSDRVAASVDPVPAHLEPLAPPPAPKVALVTPPVVKPAPVAPLPVQPPLPASETDVSPSSAAAAVPMPAPALTPAAPVAPTADPATNANTALAETTPATTPVPAAGAPDQMVIQATADAWIEVKNATGRVIYQRVLHPGDSYTVPDQPQLTLTTGNATGTNIQVGGEVLGPLKGHVLRNLPLDAASLKAKLGTAQGNATMPGATVPGATVPGGNLNPPVTQPIGHSNG